MNPQIVNLKICRKTSKNQLKLLQAFRRCSIRHFSLQLWKKWALSSNGQVRLGGVSFQHASLYKWHSFRLFRSYRGLIQGEPLFPCLFIYLIETLSYLLSWPKRRFIEELLSQDGMIREWRFPIYFMQMILPLFCKVSKENLEHLSEVLMQFWVCLKLKINLEISESILFFFAFF